VGPVASLLLMTLLVVTWRYPLSRPRYNRVQRLLSIRRRTRAKYRRKAKASQQALHVNAVRDV